MYGLNPLRKDCDLDIQYIESNQLFCLAGMLQNDEAIHP